MGAWNVGKAALGHLLPGGGDFISAAAAATKVALLSDILQLYFQARDEVYDEAEIGKDDVKRAILHARGKKATKYKRKLVIGGAKVGIAIGVAATGAVVGSIIPVAGTIAGGAAGLGAGTLLGGGVTVADQLKRKANGFVKYLRGRRGQHREQAAACILHNATKPAQSYNVKRTAAIEALNALLGIEANGFFSDRVTPAEQVARLAARMKSN